MGLQVEASLAKHFLHENCWESNLVANISNVDYLEGHQRRTNLGPLDGLHRQLLRIRPFGPYRNCPCPRVKSILQAPSEADSALNFIGRAGSSQGAVKKHNHNERGA